MGSGLKLGIRTYASIGRRAHLFLKQHSLTLPFSCAQPGTCMYFLVQQADLVCPVSVKQHSWSHKHTHIPAFQKQEAQQTQQQYEDNLSMGGTQPSSVRHSKSPKCIPV